MVKGALSEQFSVGPYSCMLRHENFYTVFIKNCDVAAAGTVLGDISMSPILNPGDSRVVLNWGAKPKDLDTYLTVPRGDPSKPDCLISYKNKVYPFVRHFTSLFSFMPARFLFYACLRPSIIFFANPLWIIKKGLQQRQSDGSTTGLGLD